ncbi:hypothetical protein ASJ81_20185 [Methanosarcina spelaei]|uniref:Uncharacterized protein n=1 Tax=Methanosarcina spelaei TaxID=1036679 RepID=A0A2A2HTJ1_9EURY|nr:hypothetical protein ASJ81_20185 [Methanosarcina spelaei]
MAVTLFVAVSITETVVAPLFVIYAYLAVLEVPCAVAADVVDNVKIKNKTMVVEAKATEHSFLFIFIVLLRYV